MGLVKTFIFPQNYMSKPALLKRKEIRNRNKQQVYISKSPVIFLIENRYSYSV